MMADFKETPSISPVSNRVWETQKKSKVDHRQRQKRKGKQGGRNEDEKEKIPIRHKDAKEADDANLDNEDQSNYGASKSKKGVRKKIDLHI